MFIINPYRFSNSGTWETKATMTTARQDCAIGVISGVIYVAGGSNGTTSVNTNEAYDIATDTWSSKAVIPYIIQRPAWAVISGKLHIVCGLDSTFGSRNYHRAYNPLTNSWEVKASYPYVLQGPAGALSSDGKFYVSGGEDFGVKNYTRAYTVGTDSWSVALATKTTAIYLQRASAVGDKIYHMGGNNGTSWLTINEEYNTTTNTWSSKASMPEDRFVPGIVTNGTDIYLLGGSNTTIRLDTVRIYNTLTNTWSLLPTTMPVAKTWMHSAISGGKIYNIGGTDSLGVTGSNYVYTI